MKRSLDWRRHPLLMTCLAAVAVVAAVEVAGAAAAVAALALVVVGLGRLGRRRVPRPPERVCVRVPAGFEYEHAFDDLFARDTDEFDLVGIHAPGPCIDLEYDLRRKRGRSTEELLGRLQARIELGHAEAGGS